MVYRKDVINMDMDLTDFSNCKISKRAYGGLSGNKRGIIYNGLYYIIKFPGNLKNRSMANVTLSYSNAPVCEYLGSHIYELLEIPVHKTIMGTCKDNSSQKSKIVVACQDFLNQGDRLLEFRELKTTFTPDEYKDGSRYEDSTSGNNAELDDVLYVINNHPLLQEVSGVSERFWDMFIVDAYIGNSDRNNGNWGIISRYAERDEDVKLELAPVFDNGACLNNKWDDEKITKCLNDQNRLISQAYKGVVCIFRNNDKRINPFQYLINTTNTDCLKALKRIVPMISLKQKYIDKLIIDNPIISVAQKTFYRSLIKIRYEQALVPAYKRSLSLSR
jgi:hypothetical protein